MKTSNYFVSLVLFFQSAVLFSTQVECKVPKDPNQRVYRISKVPHAKKSVWCLSLKTKKSKGEWTDLALRQFTPEMKDNTLKLNYTSPLTGVHIRFDVEGITGKLKVLTNHDLEINDGLYEIPLPDSLETFNTQGELSSLECEWAEDDAFLWLEEVEGKKALDWVKERSQKTQGLFEKDPRYAGIEKGVREILLAGDRLVVPVLMGQSIYNFWQDSKHVRGIWRRTSLEGYEAAEIVWETVLDLDELSKLEKENWVWKGANCLAPEHTRCLLSLSRGGKDAVAVREFDLTTQSFVENGFYLAEAKSRVSWVDRDTLFVGTDMGQGTLTQSGYPRQVRVWKRGAPLSESSKIFEAKETDMSAMGLTFFRPEGNISGILRRSSFFESEFYWLVENKLVLVPLPKDVEVSGLMNGEILVQLRSNWSVQEKTFTAGSLLAVSLSQLSGAEFSANAVSEVFVPNEKQALEEVVTTKDSVYLFLLDNVAGSLLRINKVRGKWNATPIHLPQNGSVGYLTADDYSELLYAYYESFLVPTAYYRITEGSPRPIKQAPPRFNAEPFVTTQHFAKSVDGTLVPYFVVKAKDSGQKGQPTPTLLYGYGGFEISMKPVYLGAIGRAWLGNGGAWVLANIRGGGEFGPKWHHAALKENRQRAFDDFIAVAEDLISNGLTTPRQLGIHGGSNGGLLVGATFTQRPDLFNAVICEVPLLDMMRFHKLLAGASWVGEYGNPDDPQMKEAILKYSPYQNIHPETTYPKVLFMTSTKDDRVHPGHARKMVAKMESLGKDVLFFENMEGGHGAAANIEQQIKRRSYHFTYLLQQLASP